MKGAPGLIGSLALVAVVAVGGALLTNPGVGDWYGSLNKPSWTPPAWVFGPVWTTLYAMMAIAAWLIARSAERPAWPLGLYAFQLALNLAWSGIFFTLRMPTAAAVELALLWVAIVATIVAFARASWVAAGLLVPYLAWASFAGALNVWIAANN